MHMHMCSILHLCPARLAGLWPETHKILIFTGSFLGGGGQTRATTAGGGWERNHGAGPYYLRT